MKLSQIVAIAILNITRELGKLGVTRGWFVKISEHSVNIRETIGTSWKVDKSVQVHFEIYRFHSKNYLEDQM